MYISRMLSHHVNNYDYVIKKSDIWYIHVWGGGGVC